MFLWLFLAHLLFLQSSAIAASATSLARAGNYNITAALVCAIASKLHKVLYTCEGCYNQEISARWSVGAPYSRGGCFQRRMVCQHRIPFSRQHDKFCTSITKKHCMYSFTTGDS